MKNKSVVKNDIQSKVNTGLTGDTIFLAVLSGVLLFLSFPKYGFGFFAWIAFVPLFFALRKSHTFSQGLLLGFVTGLVAYIGIIYWITSVIVNYGYLPLYVGITLMFLLACYLGAYISLFSGCIIYFRDKVPIFLTAPVLWVCLEYVKSVLLTGFPWENLGYSQYSNIYLIQFADIAGVFGISFLIVLTNAVIFEIIIKRSAREYVLAVVVCLILAGIYTYGFFRLSQVTKSMQNSAGMEVLLIQGNIDQSIKWNEKYQRETINIYEQISLKNKPVSGNLIVWPETAVPFNFQERNILHDQIVNLCLKTQSWLLFGSISFVPHADEFFNSAYLLSPKGEISGQYDKVHLVPYGEYVPLRKFMPFIEGFTAGIGDFGVGSGYYPLLMGDKKIGVLICYEGILPSAARIYKNRSADLLVNITNDAWFGATSAPFQHFSMAIFRTIETRLYLVRAANTGISGIVDPTGKVIAKSNIFQQDALKGYVKFVNISTFYAKHGDILIAICFLLIISFFLMNLKRRIKNANGKRKHTRND